MVDRRSGGRAGKQSINYNKTSKYNEDLLH